MNKKELEEIIAKLIKIGEDSEELEYWLNIFDDLPEEKQGLLYDNLKEELEKLSALN